MIKGIVKLENKPVKNVLVFLSDNKGKYEKRNNKSVTTKTNELGEFSINVPKDDLFYLSFFLVGGNKKIVLNASKIPNIVNLPLIMKLPLEINQETNQETNQEKKFNYLWLLLLIPVIYKLTKK